RHFVRVFAQSHAGDVNQPASAEVVWMFLKLLFQDSDRSARATSDFVKRCRLQREETRFGIVKPQTILLFSQTKHGNGLGHSETNLPLLLDWLPESSDEILNELELFERSLGVAALGECFGEAV